MPILTKCLACLLLLWANSAVGADIITLWGQAKAPPVPVLAAPTVQAADTALLLLDIEQATCERQRRPRCVDAVPAIAAFLGQARDARMTVIHSNTNRGSRATFLPPVAPRDDEPIVQSTVNKFLGTQLDAHLKARHIKTVIVCGTAAFGAVLHTATAAAQLGYQVVLPVDCVAGGSLYEEQAAVWSLLNGPGTMRALTATRLEAIRIEGC